MHHRSFKIELKNAVFNCRVLGNGKNVIVAFHGFGQNGDAFIPMIRNNSDRIIYSIDLPYHGHTIIKSNLTAISATLILELMVKLIEETELSYFSLLGYSIGTKFCISIFEKYYDKVDHMWLLAPDIIGTNIWYKIATYNGLTRRIFRFFMDTPWPILYVGEKLTRYKIFHREVLTLLERSLGTQKKRNVVYNTWISLKKLRWSLKRLESTFNKADSKIVFVYGDQDQLIRRRKIEQICRKIEKLNIVTLQGGGHQSIIKDFAEEEFKD